MRPHIVIVPGWRDSGPDHWQTRWQRHLPSATRVRQHDWESPVRADWVQALSAHIEALDAPVILAAHSLGCITAVSLPAHILDRVAGALLVAPADIERANAPDVLRDFGPVPLTRLPFRSTLVASTNDPYCTLDRATAFAEHWGSRVIVARDAGHINADSGHGEWSDGLRHLLALRRAAQWPMGTKRGARTVRCVATHDATI